MLVCVTEIVFVPSLVNFVVVFCVPLPLLVLLVLLSYGMCVSLCSKPLISCLVYEDVCHLFFL